MIIKDIYGTREPIVGDIIEFSNYKYWTVGLFLGFTPAYMIRYLSFGGAAVRRGYKVVQHDTISPTKVSSYIVHGDAPIAARLPVLLGHRTNVAALQPFRYVSDARKNSYMKSIHKDWEPIIEQLIEKHTPKDK